MWKLIFLIFIYEQIAKMYECLPRSAVDKYIEFCIICHARKPQTCRAPLRPILASGFMCRGQVIMSKLERV